MKTSVDRVARMLREERDMARSQMADELRAQFSHSGRVSRMTLMLAIEKAERAEENAIDAAGRGEGEE